MHSCPGNWVRRSGVRSCIVPGLPTHLEQQLNIGTVGMNAELTHWYGREDVLKTRVSQHSCEVIVGFHAISVHSRTALCSWHVKAIIIALMSCYHKWTDLQIGFLISQGIISRRLEYYCGIDVLWLFKTLSHHGFQAQQCYPCRLSMLLAYKG